MLLLEALVHDFLSPRQQQAVHSALPQFGVLLKNFLVHGLAERVIICTYLFALDTLEKVLLWRYFSLCTTTCPLANEPLLGTPGFLLATGVAIRFLV